MICSGRDTTPESRAGGVFSGFLQIRYDSATKAQQEKASIEASVGKLGFSGSVNIDFDQSVQESTQSQSTRASYNAIGWNIAAEDIAGNVKVPPPLSDYVILPHPTCNTAEYQRKLLVCSEPLAAAGCAPHRAWVRKLWNI